MNNFLFRAVLLSLLLPATICTAQKSTSFNLSQMLKDGQLVFDPGQHVNLLTDDASRAVSLHGIVWLKGVIFDTGSIDVDIRGKDVFQQSFVGIAFHGVDTITYESVYFRPFNFRSPDPLRIKHTVQYISQPDYPWDRLRNEHPLMYENEVTPMPQPTDWFHAHIVVGADEITVYVNQSATPSLKVKKLNNLSKGMIGLWSSSLSGDFKSLVITQ